MESFPINVDTKYISSFKKKLDNLWNDIWAFEVSFSGSQPIIIQVKFKFTTGLQRDMVPTVRRHSLPNGCRTCSSSVRWCFQTVLLVPLSLSLKSPSHVPFLISSQINVIVADWYLNEKQFDAYVTCKLFIIQLQCILTEVTRVLGHWLTAFRDVICYCRN